MAHRPHVDLVAGQRRHRRVGDIPAEGLRQYQRNGAGHQHREEEQARPRVLADPAQDAHRARRAVAALLRDHALQGVAGIAAGVFTFLQPSVTPPTLLPIVAVWALVTGTLDQLVEAGWVKPAGRRDTPGRPVTWVTTPATLVVISSLRSIEPLPSLEPVESAVRILPGTLTELKIGSLVLPKKLSTPESSEFFRLRVVSFSTVALSVILTLTVRMSPT